MNAVADLRDILALYEAANATFDDDAVVIAEEIFDRADEIKCLVLSIGKKTYYF